VLTVSIALMMEAENTSETFVNFYQTTWHNIPEDSHLHTHCRENLKSHQIKTCLVNDVIILEYDQAMRLFNSERYTAR
jgi:hypothetical protein